MTETLSLDPEFEWVETPVYQTVMTPFESGESQLRAKWQHPKRRWTLQWKNASPEDTEELRAFFRHHVGAATEFYYVPTDKVPRPYAAPTTGTSVRVETTEKPMSTEYPNFGSRTLHAGFTWSDSSDNETQISVNTQEQSVSNGSLLTVTIPEFPTNVTKAWIYVGTAAGTVQKQDTAVTTSAGTWTEPVEGWNQAGGASPTTNALSETVTVHFAEDSLQIVKKNAYTYTMRVELEELL